MHDKPNFDVSHNCFDMLLYTRNIIKVINASQYD